MPQPRSRFPAYPPDLDPQLQLFLESIRKELEGLGTLGEASVIVKEGGVILTPANTLDFSGPDFVLSESPSDEVNISIDANLARLNTIQTWTAKQTFSGGIAGPLTIDTGTVTINPGPLVIGTDPTGIGALRVGGAGRFVSGDGVSRSTQLGLGRFSDTASISLYELQTADLDATFGEDSFFVYTGRWGSQVWFARGSAAGDRAFARFLSTGTGASTEFRLFDATALTGGVTGVLLRGDGVVVVGTDPGGPEVLRAGGGGRFDGGLKLGRDAISSPFWLSLTKAGVSIKNGIRWGTDATPDASGSIWQTTDAVSEIHFSTSGVTDLLALVPTAFRPASAGGLTLGTAGLPWGTTYVGKNGLLQVEAQDGVNEGGEIILVGAGANPNWTFDNFQGVVRLFTGGVEKLRLSAAALTPGTTAGGVTLGTSSVPWGGGFFGPSALVATPKLVNFRYNRSSGGALIFEDSNAAPGATWEVGIGAGDAADRFTWYNTTAAARRLSLNPSGLLEIVAGGLQVTAGNVGVGGAPNTWAGATVTGTIAASPANISYGVFNDILVNSPTADARVYGARLNTAAAAFTLTAGKAVHILDAVKGAGSAITTQYGLFIDSLTAGVTNYSVFTNDGLVRFGDRVAIGGDPYVARQLTLTGSAGLSGTTQFGATFDPAYTSAATTEGIGLQIRGVTQAAAFTMTQVTGLLVDDVVKGAGSAITTAYGIRVASIASGATNYAIFTNGGLVRLGDRVDATARLTVAGSVDLGQSTTEARFHSNRWRFAVSGGDEANAGTIAYRLFDATQLEIVGAGTGASRLVRIYDNLGVGENAQGGWSLRLVGDLKIGSLGTFDSTDTPTDQQLLVFKAGTTNKWQAETIQFMWGNSDFKAALLADNTATTFVFRDPGTGADSPVGAPPVPATPIVSQDHLVHTLEIRDYTKPADFRYFEWEYCTGAACTVTSALATTTSTKLVHARLVAGTVYRYKVRAVDQAGNASAFSALTADQTAQTSSETHAFGAIIAGEIAVANLAAISAAIGVITSGQIRGPANTDGINFSAVGGIPGTWTAGINFENTSLGSMTRYLNFNSSAGGTFLKHERLEVNFDGSVKMYQTSSQPMFKLDATDFLLQNDAVTPTQGILIDGTLPAAWTRYLSLTGSGTMLKHDKLELNFDGTAKFTGQLDITDAQISQTIQNFHILLRDPDVAHGMTDLVATDVLGAIGFQNTLEGGLNILGFSETNPGLLLQGVATTLGSAVRIEGWKKNLAGRTALSGAEIILNVLAGSGAERFTFNANGLLTLNGNIAGTGLRVEQGSTPTANALYVQGGSLTGAQIVATVALLQTWNTTGAPVGIRYDVTDTASAAGAELLGLFVGAVGKFNIRKDGRTTIAGELLTALAGTEAAPSIAKSDDPDTGIFWPGANLLGLAAGGQEHARIDSASGLLTNGRATGVPTLPVPAHNDSWSGTAGTGAVTTEVTLRTATAIPGGTTGANGSIWIRGWGSVTGTAGIKTIRVKLAGTTITTFSYDAPDVGQFWFEVIVRNNASESSQHVGSALWDINDATVGAMFGVIPSNAGQTIATGADSAVSVTGQTANAGDEVTLNGLVVAVFPQG